MRERIARHVVDTFYVGCQGAFDALTLSVLRELALQYPHIRYAAVLERLPIGSTANNPFDRMNG